MFFKIVFFFSFLSIHLHLPVQQKTACFYTDQKTNNTDRYHLDFLNFPAKNTQRVNLELLVADYDRIGSSDPIGKVLLGYNRKGLELKHWKEMIENPRRPIVHWHVLKVNQLPYSRE